MTISTLISKSLHSKVKGDFEKSIKALIKANIFNGSTAVIINVGIKVTSKYVKLSELNPLDSQRSTALSWAVKRLIDQGGLDMLALGTIEVADVDGELFVWDGCGRLALAQLSGIDKIRCNITKMSKEKAAYHFAYNQSRGKRNLNKEQIFVNSATAKDSRAMKWAKRLDLIEAYIEGDTDTPISANSKLAGHPEMKYRTLEEGYKITYSKSKSDTQVCSDMKQVKNMIKFAWPNITMIPQDLFLALSYFFKTTPKARLNGFNDNIQSYLNYIAIGNTIGDVSKEWKLDAKGLSGNAGAAKQMALSFANAYKRSKLSTQHYRNSINWEALK